MSDWFSLVEISFREITMARSGIYINIGLNLLLILCVSFTLNNSRLGCSLLIAYIYRYWHNIGRLEGTAGS